MFLPNPLPPLPVIDGDYLFFDNSTLDYLITCPRSAGFKILDQRELADERWAMRFGGIFHNAMQVRYTDCPMLCANTPTEANMLAGAQTEFEQTPPPPEQYRTLSLMTSLVKGYNQKYQVEDWDVVIANGKPLVEVPFLIKLGELKVPWRDKPYIIMYMGKIDLVVSLGGQIYTLDFKTTSIMGKGFWEEMSVTPQFEGYCWAWWKQMKTLPTGYIVRAIRTRAPLKRDDTGEPTSKRAKRRGDVEPDDFEEARHFVDEERLLEWEYNTMAIISNFVTSHYQGYLPAHKKWCVGKYGRCQYFEVCNLPLDNRQLLLHSSMFVDSKWSPLAGDGSGHVQKVSAIDYDNLMKPI